MASAPRSHRRLRAAGEEPEPRHRVQLGVVAGGAGLSVGGVPEADAADVGDRAQRLAFRGWESAAADERRAGGDDRPCAVAAGWDMAPYVGLLSELPARAILDGEHVALDADAKPDFSMIGECPLQRRYAIPLT